MEGKSYKLSKNTLVISRVGERHHITFDEQGPYERYNILYNENRLPFKLSEKLPKSVDIINFDGNAIVCELFKKTDYYSSQFEGEELSRLLCGITEEIFFNIIIAAKNDVSQDRIASSNPVVASAIDYINENILTISDLDELCKTLYITKSHLHHLFTRYLQISPKQYILSKRLSLARSAIRSGQRPVNVYTECGFSDYSTFYRDYKKHFGHSPSREGDFEPDSVILS